MRHLALVARNIVVTMRAGVGWGWLTVNALCEHRAMQE